MSDSAAPQSPATEGDVEYAVSNDGRIRLPKPVGFVFGGGGSLGAIEVGQIQAWEQTGIKPDLIVGTSIGSLNGAVMSEDPETGSSRLAEIWPTVDESLIMPGGVTSTIAAFRPSRPNIVTHDGVIGVIEKYIDVDSFEGLALPFGVVTFNAHTNLLQVLSQGALLPALLASCTIPGVFPPVRYDDMLLYDGGLAANVPIRQAIEMGAKSVVVMDCIFPGTAYREPTHMQGSMLFALTTLLRQQVFGDLNWATERVPVVYLPGPKELPELGPQFILDFSHTDELIAGAYDACQEYLATAESDGSPGIYWPPLHNPRSF